MDFISTTILIALSTGFLLVTVLFGSYQLYKHIYNDHQLIPHISFYTYQLVTMSTVFVMGILMLVSTVINNYWAGITSTSLLIDLAFIFSNRAVYSREQLIFMGVHHLLIVILIVILLVTLKIGFLVISVIPWCLIWNSSSLCFTVYGIWATNHKITLPEISYSKLYSGLLITTIVSNIWRFVTYPLLFLFNLDHLGAAGLALGLALPLHAFKLYAEIKILVDLKGKI